MCEKKTLCPVFAFCGTAFLSILHIKIGYFSASFCLARRIVPSHVSCILNSSHRRQERVASSIISPVVILVLIALSYSRDSKEASLTLLHRCLRASFVSVSLGSRFQFRSFFVCFASYSQALFARVCKVDRIMHDQFDMNMKKVRVEVKRNGGESLLYNRLNYIKAYLTRKTSWVQSSFILSLVMSSLKRMQICTLLAFPRFAELSNH